MSRNQRYATHQDNLVKDYSRKRWLILSLLSVEIDLAITWLSPLDLQPDLAPQLGREPARQLDDANKVNTV